MNLVFVWAEDGTKLKVDVPVVFKGEHECPGLKKGKGFSSSFCLCFFLSVISCHIAYGQAYSSENDLSFASNKTYLFMGTVPEKSPVYL